MHHLAGLENERLRMIFVRRIVCDVLEAFVRQEWSLRRIEVDALLAADLPQRQAGGIEMVINLRVVTSLVQFLKIGSDITHFLVRVGP